MSNNEGMGRREIGPETEDDDVIASHKRNRLDNHGAQSRAARRTIRRARRLVRADLRNWDGE